MNAVRWASSKMGDGVAAVGRALVSRWARKWADGGMGARATSFYYWCSSHAGAICALVAGAAGCLLTAAQMPGYMGLVGLDAAEVELWSVRLAYVWPVLVSAKLASDKWHDIGQPKWISSPQGLWLKDHSPMLTTAVGVAWWYAERCTGSGWCDAERWVLFVVGVIGANFGILPRAGRAIPPAKVLEALAGVLDPPTPAVAVQAAAVAVQPDALLMQAALVATATGEATGEVSKDDARRALDIVARKIEPSKEA